jgi:hypothetical protein
VVSSVPVAQRYLPPEVAMQTRRDAITHVNWMQMHGDRFLQVTHAFSAFNGEALVACRLLGAGGGGFKA